MTELKPCPFCGGEAVLERSLPTGFDGEEWYYIYCSKAKNSGGNQCPASPVVSKAGDNAKERAIEAWNTRQNPWHTGTPTEEGCFYVLQCKGFRHPEPYFGVVVNGEFSAINCEGDLMPLPPDLIAWQKITPFEEGEEVNG